MAFVTLILKKVVGVYVLSSILLVVIITTRQITLRQ